MEGGWEGERERGRKERYWKVVQRIQNRKVCHPFLRLGQKMTSKSNIY